MISQNQRNWKSKAFARTPPNSCYHLQSMSCFEKIMGACQKRMESRRMWRKAPTWMTTEITDLALWLLPSWVLRVRLRHSEVIPKQTSVPCLKDLGLPTWEKQSFACLSSRFVYGETIDQREAGNGRQRQSSFFWISVFTSCVCAFTVRWRELKFFPMSFRRYLISGNRS